MAGGGREVLAKSMGVDSLQLAQGEIAYSEYRYYNTRTCSFWHGVGEGSSCITPHSSLHHYRICSISSRGY